MKTPPKKGAMLVGVAALLAGAVLFGYMKYQQMQVLIVNIGSYKSQQAEEIAAIQRLSMELTKHPEVKSVRILAGDSRWHQGVMGFVRSNRDGQKNIFWMDNRFSSAAFNVRSGVGIRAEVLVSEEPIHESASRFSTFDDVDYYNEQLRSRPILNVFLSGLTVCDSIVGGLTF